MLICIFYKYQSKCLYLQIAIFIISFVLLNCEANKSVCIYIFVLKSSVPVDNSEGLEEEHRPRHTPAKRRRQRPLQGSEEWQGNLSSAV